MDLSGVEEVVLNQGFNKLAGFNPWRAAREGLGAFGKRMQRVVETPAIGANFSKQQRLIRNWAQEARKHNLPLFSEELARVMPKSSGRSIPNLIQDIGGGVRHLGRGIKADPRAAAAVAAAVGGTGIVGGLGLYGLGKGIGNLP